MIRIIPCYSDGEFDVRGIRYLDTTTFELLRLIDSTFCDKLFKNDVPAHFRLDYLVKDEQGKYKKSIGQDILCLDFDLKVKRSEYKDYGEEENAVIEKIVKAFKIGTECMTVVYTGYGLHIFILFDESFFVSNETYLTSLYSLLDLKNSIYNIDTQSFTTAKTMRLPASLYVKKDRVEKHTLILNKASKVYPFKAFRDRFKHLQGKVKERKDKEDFKNIFEWKRIDWEGIVGKQGQEWSGCRFVRYLFENQRHISYQEYMSGLTILSKMFKDEQTAYNYAKLFFEKYPDFDEAEFATKFHEARYKMYPNSCEHIEKIYSHANDNRVGCKTCPHRRLNMPLNVTYFPNKENGFRIMKMTKAGLVPTKIDYASLNRYFNEVEKIYPEKDETLYQYNGKSYEPIPINTVVDKYSHLVQPSIEPHEIGNIKTFVKNFNIFDREKEQKKNERYLVFKNLILDYQTGNTYNHTPEIKSFYHFSFDYTANIKTPVFDEFTEFAFSGNKQERDYFFKYMAVALFGNEHLEKALVLVGDGANGKSTLMNAIRNLYPIDTTLFTPFDPSMLTKRRHL